MAKYKIVALPKQKYAKGGGPDPKTTFYTVEGSGGVYRKVNGKWEVDWNRSGKFQPLSKGDVAKRTAVLNSQAKPLYDATYDDIYTTENTVYTAPPKEAPTPVKKPTAQDKAAQELFDKAFAVPIKSKKEIVEDKIQKGIDEYVKYHNEKYDKPLTQEEYDDAYQDIYNRAYANAGVYSGATSGPVANPYGTTKPRKNLISLDPGKAPKNMTLGDYVDKGWDIVTNPLDYASYALKPKGTVTIPWNMTNYENRLEAAGLEDPVTANNNVNKAIDFASYFIGPGMVAQGLKMVPGTVNSIGRAFVNPSWENTGNAVWDASMTALSIAPGFGMAKNLGKGASSIDDLRAIEALKGNTKTTPFQSYYLTGNRALNASEAAIPQAQAQAQALRRFTGQQPLELPAGQPEFFNSEYKKLYDELQESISKQKAVSDELANFDPMAKINQSKVDNKAFNELIMGDDLKFKFDDYPDTPRIPVRYAGLEQIRPRRGPISLNAVGEVSAPKPSSRLPRGTAQQSALNDLEKLREQTITGQDEALLRFEELQEQKLKDLKTPEGRRRIQEFIDDNDIKGEYDEGNVTQLKDEYVAELPKIVESKDTNKINDIIKNVKKHYANKGALRAQRNAKNSGLQSWDELTAADIERAANPSSINDVILKENITTALAEVDPRNTSGFKKFSVDDYIEHIEQTAYDTKSAEIFGYELEINKQKSILQNKINELNRLRRETNNGADLPSDSYKKQYDSIVRALRNDIKASEALIKNYESSLKSAQNYLNRRNANADILNNEINLGNPFTAIGDLEPTIYHEFGHITEGSFLPINSNSAIDKDLISELDFLDEAPEYLFQQLDSDKILSETFPYNISKQGTSKYKNPEGYFKEAKEYFLKGGNDLGASMEPSAFAVELRPALKRLGLIKNDFDKVTPEMVKELYEAYTTNPEFKFLDLRILDIIKPTEKSFKTLSKNLNKIKGIVPYAIPIGLGVGATGLAGQEEMQQDMEYQDGGIIMELSDDEIQEYANGGFVVEELDYKPDAGKKVNKPSTTPKVTPKVTISTTGLAYKPSASVKPQQSKPIQVIPVSRQGMLDSLNIDTTPVKQSTVKPVVEETVNIFDKYSNIAASPVISMDSLQEAITKSKQEKQARIEKLERQLAATKQNLRKPAVKEIQEVNTKQPVMQTYTYADNYVEGLPNVRTEQSESYLGGRPLKNEVKKIVLHHTGSTDEKNNNKYVHNHFMNPKSETSAHIVIEEDGTRTVYASPDQVTFHAGRSSWDGRDNVNDFGVGVEFQGDTNVKPLTSAQVKSFVEYFDQLARKYNLSTKDIITHAMIAPGRKPDITESQYKRILKYLNERGYK